MLQVRRLVLLILAVASLASEVRTDSTINVGYYDMAVGAGVVAEQAPPIAAAGFTPVQLFNVTAADLAGIHVLFVQNPSPMMYGAEYLASLPAIQNAVSAGMVLVIHDRLIAAGPIGARTILPVLPGGAPVLSFKMTSNNIRVTDAGSLVANGPHGTITNGNLDGGGFSTNGYVNFATAPAGKKGLIHRANTTEAVTFSYPLNLGFVVYSTIPLDMYLKGLGSNPARDNFNNIYAPNVLAYAASLRSWSPTLTVEPSTGEYGGTTTLTARLMSGLTPLAGMTINFSLNGTSVGSPQTTNSLGTATLTNVSLGSVGVGSYAEGVGADFAGSGLFNPSSGSAALAVTRAPLTVTAEDKSTIYGTELPAFTARYDGFVLDEDVSTLGGTLTFATPATETSPVGPYAITPYGLTSDNYEITFSGGTLTVTPAAPLTITANNTNRLYGGTNPAFDGTIVGILGGDNITASYSTRATSSSPVGTYDIVPTFVDPDGRLANYGTPTVVKGVLTITPAAALTVTANNTDRLYGGANPAFDGTIAGILGGDNITASYATEATSSSPVGTYDIVPTFLDPDGRLANYADVTAVNGVLTITPAPLTVTANDKNRLYGGTNPAFDGTIVGIQGEDNITASYATAAISSSPVGTYDIVPTLLDPNGRLANYGDVTVVNGVFTITTTAALTVTANNKNRLYGGTNPTFDGTIVGILGEDNITASYATQATSSSAVGAYDIVPTLLDPDGRLANYEPVTVVNGVLTITRAATVTVTANNKNRLYGGANQTLNGTIVGIQGQDNITASYATQATSSSPVGTYDIVPTLLDPNGRLANYEGGTVVNGVLTINRAPLTVTADDKERLVGIVNPPLTVTYSGFVNGETAASLDVRPTVTTAVVLASLPGRYPIGVSGAVDPNYAIAHVNGTFTVSPEGRMQGQGRLIASGGARNHFRFDVRDRVSLGERGDINLRIHRARPPEDDEADSDADNGDEGPADSRHDRFVSHVVTSVTFSDNPEYTPGGGPLADTVLFTGVGTWNGVGATFLATASDRGEPGRGVDQFSISIRVGGIEVASIGGTLERGNVQSNRLPGGNR